jgi:hypothetical protein
MSPTDFLKGKNGSGPIMQKERRMKMEPISMTVLGCFLKEGIKKVLTDVSDKKL